MFYFFSSIQNFLHIIYILFLFNLFQIIHIDGGFTKCVSSTYLRDNQNLIPFEIIINKRTVVEFFGFHAPLVPSTNAVRSVDFQTIIEASGLICEYIIVFYVI